MRPRGAKRGNEAGVAMVLCALLLVTMLAIAALVVDLGNGRQAKRHAQNAVDAAALVAASYYDGTAGTLTGAKTRGLELLQANGFTQTSIVATASNTYTCGAPDSCSVTFSASAVSGRTCLQVAITQYRVDTFFAGVIGRKTLSVGATAKGCKTSTTTSTTIPAVMTVGSCSSSAKAFVTSGNNNRLEGGIHSNDDVTDNGTANTRTGTATMVEAPPTSNNGLWTGYSATTTQTNPLSAVTASLYAPGGARAVSAGAFYVNSSSSALTFTSGSTIAAGVYYTNHGIKVEDNVSVVSRTISGVTKTGVTLVSSAGLVEIYSGVTLTPFVDDPNRITVLAGWDESGDNCDKEPLKISGNCSLFDGVIYAPFGKIRLSGEGNGHDYGTGASCVRAKTPSYSGGLVAWSFESSGNYSVLRGGIAGSSTSTPELFLDS
jgi:Flp pilus assembly protein TadG